MIAVGLKRYLNKYGRICVMDAKEKYGTVRVYCYFGYSCFHSLFFPNKTFVIWPKWLYAIDLWLSERIIKFINKLAIPYQKYIYRRAYTKAVRENPDLAINILQCADWPEYLEDLYKKHIMDEN